MASPSEFTKTLEDLCREIGADLTFEPNFQRTGFITFSNGARRFFKGTNFDLNLSAAAQIAQDKDFCARFLYLQGLHSPEGVVAFAPKCIAKWQAKNPDVARSLDPFAAADRAGRDWGFPLFVKPNEGAEGEGVRLVRNDAEMRAHLERLFVEHDRVLIQRPAAGDDYRLVVLDGEVMLAYQRLPLCVTGTGHQTIGELLSAHRARLATTGRQAVAAPDDPRIAAHLTTQGLTLEDRPAAGQTVRLLANANLSTGGAVVDVTEKVDARTQAIAVEAAAAVGLRFAGVDLLCQSIETFDPAYTVLEINGAPGLNNFAATHDTAKERVTRLYRAVLNILQDEAGA